MVYKDCFTAMPDKFQFRSLAPTSLLFPQFCHMAHGLFSFQTEVAASASVRPLVTVALTLTRPQMTHLYQAPNSRWRRTLAETGHSFNDRASIVELKENSTHPWPYPSEDLRPSVFITKATIINEGCYFLHYFPSESIKSQWKDTSFYWGTHWLCCDSKQKP